MIKPVLTISGYAWNKIMFLNSLSKNEYGAFCIAHPQDPLYVEDFRLCKQTVTSVTVKLDDDSQADYVQDMVDLGLPLENFYRIWMHTHPGSCKTPSGLDNTNFDRTLAECDWAIMLIVTKKGDIYAKLHHGFPEVDTIMDVEIDYSDATPTNPEAWKEEFEENVEEDILAVTTKSWVKQTQSGLVSDYEYKTMPNLDLNSDYFTQLDYEEAVHQAHIAGEINEEAYDQMSMEIWHNQEISAEIKDILKRYPGRGLYGNI